MCPPIFFFQCPPLEKKNRLPLTSVCPLWGPLVSLPFALLIPFALVFARILSREKGVFAHLRIRFSKQLFFKKSFLVLGLCGGICLGCSAHPAFTPFCSLLLSTTAIVPTALIRISPLVCIDLRGEQGLHSMAPELLTPGTTICFRVVRFSQVMQNWGRSFLHTYLKLGLAAHFSAAFLFRYFTILFQLAILVHFFFLPFGTSHRRQMLDVYALFELFFAQLFDDTNSLHGAASFSCSYHLCVVVSSPSNRLQNKSGHFRSRNLAPLFYAGLNSQSPPPSSAFRPLRRFSQIAILLHDVWQPLDYVLALRGPRARLLLTVPFYLIT